MGRPRKPLVLLESEGKSHRTKAELEQRRREEVSPADPTFATPDDLERTEKAKFRKTAQLLKALKIWDKADTDELARYAHAQVAYEKLTKMYAKAVAAEDLDAMERIGRQQNTAYQQAQKSGSLLGLNIMSRCKITLPPEKQEKSAVDF
jgi:P27 family predicted phage terminase small subunit